MINLILNRENFNFKVIRRSTMSLFIIRKKYHSYQDRAQSMWIYCSVTLDVKGVTDTNSS